MAEPGVKGRFVFAADIYATVRAIVRASADLPPDEARLLKVLLGSVLVSNSNVTINGKGRRYRRGWETRRRLVEPPQWQSACCQPARYSPGSHQWRRRSALIGHR